MDNVERMFRHLVRVIRTRYPQYLTQPFDVAELHQNILPYRHHRRELGLETNEDYEITMLELLGGNHDYVILDDRMREALKTELTSRNPDPAAFRQFSEAQITLSASAIQRLDATPTAVPPMARPAAIPTPQRTAPPPRAPDAGIVPQPGDRCRSCDEPLPPGRAIVFCPHCGQNLTKINCPACGSELELGWRFCPACGRPTGK